MKDLKSALRLILGNPYMLLIPATLSFLLGIAFLSNPLLRFISNAFGNMSPSSSSKDLLALLMGNCLMLFQLIIGKHLLSFGFWRMVAGKIIFISVVGSFFLSGYINLIKNVFEGEDISSTHFIKGVGRYFIRMALQFMSISIILVLFGIIQVFCLTPCVFLLYALVSGVNDLVVQVSILFVLTILLALVTFLFIKTNCFARIFSQFWVKKKRNEGRLQSYMIKKQKLWETGLQLMMIDVLYLLYISTILYFKFTFYKTIPMEGFAFGPVVIFITNWIANTFYIATFVAFLVWTFHKNSMHTINHKSNSNLESIYRSSVFLSWPL